MPINTVEVYCDLVLTLYAKGSVLRAVVVIFVMFTAVSEWLKALLDSFMLIEVILLDIRFPKVVK